MVYRFLFSSKLRIWFWFQFEMYFKSFDFGTVPLRFVRLNNGAYVKRDFRDSRFNFFFKFIGSCFGSRPNV